jgi:hypothetical protein
VISAQAPATSSTVVVPLSHYRVTYCAYESGEHLAADDPKLMRREEILALMRKVLTSPGSFVSVMDASGTMIQFVLDDDGSVMLDIPHPNKRGSYAKRTTLTACVTAVEKLGDTIRLDEVDGLVFERW